MDALAILGAFRSENMSLLLTARTGPNDVLFDRVEEIFDKRVVQEFDIERMDEPELEEVNDIFEQYGLWGEKSSLARKSRTPLPPFTLPRRVAIDSGRPISIAPNRIPVWRSVANVGYQRWLL
jgi:hypothetical protein